ncbi:MAG: hypothetical protein ACREJB_05480 [Planctomycetaceae bacterium]
MSYRGHVRNGVVVLAEDVQWPEGTEVRVSLPEEDESEQKPEQIAPTLSERLRPIIGAAQGLPPDASTNVDHYLYGHPKR